MRLLLLGLAVLSLSAPSARAGEARHYRLTPYAWFAGLQGDVATIPGAPSAPVDVPASDALRDTEASLMLLIDARQARHGVLADLFYSDVRSDEELLPPPIALTLASVTKTTVASIAYQYELFRQDRVLIDFMLGARYWAIDAELTLGGGSGPLAGRSVTHTESWVDPLTGIKGRLPLGDSKIYAEGGAAIGGFGMGSDVFYDLNGAIGYQWNKAVGSAIGYRMFDVDYDHDGFVYDARQQGWQLGITWAF
jgi:hypothetical protein